MSAQFFLVLILLDPRSGALHKYMIDRPYFPLEACQNLAYYFKEYPVRGGFDDHGPWVVQATSCVRRYEG